MGILPYVSSEIDADRPVLHAVIYKLHDFELRFTFRAARHNYRDGAAAYDLVEVFTPVGFDYPSSELRSDARAESQIPGIPLFQFFADRRDSHYGDTEILTFVDKPREVSQGLAFVVAPYKDGNSHSSRIEADNLLYGCGNAFICQVLANHAGASGYPEDDRFTPCGIHCRPQYTPGYKDGIAIGKERCYGFSGLFQA